MDILDNKPKVILYAFLFFIALTLGMHKLSHAAPTGSGLTTVQITNHSLTGDDSSTISMQIEVSANAAHIIWQEQNLASTNSDLFYRTIPNGQTQRISDIADTNGNVITFPTFRVSAAGVPHVIWEEDTGTAESRDLYYWNASDGTQRLTDRTETEGDVLFNSKQLWLDDAGEAHVVWQELNNSQTENIYFYWNSISGLVQQLPGYEASAIKDSVLHVVWEASQNGPVQYWNSNSQMTQSLPNSTTSGNVSVQQKGIFAQESGAITIFFGKIAVGDPSTDCLLSWNSSTQNTTTHVTGEQCFGLNNVIQDGTGAFHAFGVDFASAVFSPFYWNSNLTNPILFDTSSTGTGFGIPGASLRVAENGKAHILWQDDNNFYYWNPVEQQIINLSESLGPGTFISFPQFSYLDHAGELNFIWTEAGHPNFWHSNEKVTYNLLTKLDMSNISYQFLANAAPVYLFQGTPNMGNAGLFYWDISADSLVPVWSGLIDASNVQYLENSDGKVFVGWIEDSTKLFRLYSSIEGISVLNSTATNENELIFNLKLDDFNNLYATWTEASDTAGKGIDYFAAWPTAFVEGSTNVFLPIIISN